MIFRYLLILFIISSCALSPGFKKEPTSKNPKRMGLEQNGVSLTFYNLNKINVSSLPRIKDIKKKSKEKIKELMADDKYYYTLGYGDVINISLTDIEDIDGSYTVSPNGGVTIPYVGEVQVQDKTKAETEEPIKTPIFTPPKLV